MRSKRFGNVVLVASNQPQDWIGAIAPLGPHPALTVSGVDSAEWSAAGKIVTDATAIDSPPPGRQQFRT
jgi:hypothetical protein